MKNAVWMSLFGMLVFGRVPLAGAETPEKKETPTEKSSDFYAPIEKTIEGWTVKVDPKLLEPEDAEVQTLAFKALANHLQRVEFIVPKERLADLKKIKIWLDLNHPRIRGMQYHPGLGWLKANKHDPR
ncbi:MAG: hypothetical protein KDA84_20890, partial [Planctomycetaceae bacterium]|nr:hypothetical protein [Planctomycetaceae bacterium]